MAFPHIGSYLGVPIRLSDGAFFGTLCAVDPDPQTFAPPQVELLVVLARLLATQIERDRELAARRCAEEALRESEERFRALIQHASDVVVVLGGAGRVGFVAPSIERTLAYPGEALVGTSVFDLVHPDDARPAATALTRTAPGAALPGPIEVRLRHADGSWRWFEVLGNNRLDDPAVKGIVVNARDITERKEADRTRARLAAIVESSDDAIIGKALDGTITSWNPGAERLYGYTAAEAIGRSIALLVPSDLPDEVPVLLARVARGERVDHYETTRLAKVGRRLHVSLTVSPIREAGGAIIGAATIARDVTERKLAEEGRAAVLAAEREYTRRREELSLLRADFTAMVAHELGSPIAAIRRSADLLATEPLSPDQTWALGVIQGEAQALRALVADVQAIATIERDDFSVHPRPVAVEALLADAVAFARTLPGDHPLSTEVEVDGQVQADRERIGQVLRNLLANAAKYSPSGAPITLRARRSGDRVRIEVSDRGPGIHPDDLPRIFQKFGRGRDEAGRHIPGVGLGLYLSRRIAQAHGTDLMVASTPGDGATFGFELEVAS